jgi:hypothetical protein
MDAGDRWDAGLTTGGTLQMGFGTDKENSPTA